MAEIKPFRALRYAAETAGPIADLVSPPYDVLSEAQRDDYRARSPFNIVTLTLADDEAASGPLFREWQERGVLVRDERPALWWLEQEFVGPDGVARTRSGFLASIRVEPYDRRVVLPHERTHTGPKESRLRLLNAVRAQLEPIFLLFDDASRPELAVRDAREGAADLEASEGGVTSRLWRVDDEAAIAAVTSAFADQQVLIADGHHRYETALAFHEQDGSDETAFTFAAFVNTQSEGLSIFPTHRVFASAPSASLGEDQPATDPSSALAEIEVSDPSRPIVVTYVDGDTRIVEGGEPIADVELVDRLGHDGISYTPDWREAIAAVDEGRAELAVLMRPPRIDQVFEVARAGRVMPQKSTYFYPKLLSGLLIHPL